jgi:hypothetical protein
MKEQRKEKMGISVLVGYKIGDHIEIHGHINDPESWFLTIRPLEIFSESLCKKTYTTKEKARHINVKLHKKLSVIEDIIKSIIPHT